jgi:hypothetical protein
MGKRPTRCRALELELRRRFYLHKPKAFKVRSGWTIGTPVHAFTKRKQDINASANLKLIFELVAPQYRRALAKQLWRLKTVHKTRNRLAHSNPLSKAEAVQLRTLILGSRQQPGILCWLAEHVQPAPAPGT